MSDRSGAAWVRAAVAARRLGVDVRTVRRWVALGVIDGRRVRTYRDGRCSVFVVRAALDELLRPAPKDSREGA